MPLKLVSIIIPCFNGEKYLQQTLECVVMQTYKHWECILIDDGSTDSSASIFKEYSSGDERFKYFYQKNAGLAASRNQGIILAKGDYIQFLDADDLMVSERLQKCVERMESDASFDVVYSDFVTFQQGQGFLKNLPAKIPHEDTFRAFLFEFNITFAVIVHSLLFKRSVIEKNKFDETLHSHAEDYDCWVRVALSGAVFSYINEVLVIYRMTSTNLTSNEVKLISAKLTVLQQYKLHERVKLHAAEYSASLIYLQQRLVMGYFMQKSFKSGYLLLKEIWKKSSLPSKVKMCGWGILMIIFSKQFIIEARLWIVKYTPLKWGGWKYTEVWKAPPALVQLMEKNK